MEINCEFCFGQLGSSPLYYTCTINEAKIKRKNHVIKEIRGVHREGKTHSDVECVRFISATVDHFPRGLEKHFPNLTHLFIRNCDIKEISKNDLKGLHGLVCLGIQNCQLTSLPDDLLTEMPNLREVSFLNNQIIFVTSEVLKPLRGRQNVIVNFAGNTDIDACFWPGKPKSLKSLEDLMKLIDEKYIEPNAETDPIDFNPLIKEMWISGSYSDLTIIANDKEFRVHRNILGSANAVFDRMFQCQQDAIEIKISEFNSQAVEALLKFIYTSEVTDDENSAENFRIADKFKVAAMKSKYEEIILRKVNDSNAWENFLFAHNFGSYRLKERAFQQIASTLPDELPVNLMEDPDKLKQLLDARQVYKEILDSSKKELKLLQSSFKEM